MTTEAKHYYDELDAWPLERRAHFMDSVRQILSPLARGIGIGEIFSLADKSLIETWKMTQVQIGLLNETINSYRNPSITLEGDYRGCPGYLAALEQARQADASTWQIYSGRSYGCKLCEDAGVIKVKLPAGEYQYSAGGYAACEQIQVVRRDPSGFLVK